MITLIVLLLICVFIIYNTREPGELIEVKERYRILREHIEGTGDEKFKMLVDVVPITGMKKMKNSVGSNTNKGSEIVVCLDGEVNEIFHVLLHELAHCTVKEYSHSEAFWKNYTELRNMAIEIGIYEEIPQRTKFCGQHIQDK